MVRVPTLENQPVVQAQLVQNVEEKKSGLFKILKISVIVIIVAILVVFMILFFIGKDDKNLNSEKDNLPLLDNVSV